MTVYRVVPLLTGLSLFFAFAVAPARGQGPPLGAQSVNIRDFQAKCDGSTDDSGALKAAIRTVEKIGGGVVFSPKLLRYYAPPLSLWSTTCVIGTDVVIPSSVTTYVLPGALISVPVGVTLTILGPFPNGCWQTFSTKEEQLFTVGTGNGSQTVFTGTLPYAPIRPTTPSVVVGGSEIGTDDGMGNFTFPLDSTGNVLISGTIAYSTGAVSLTFKTAPAPSVPIQIKKRTGVSFGEYQSCQGGPFGPHCYSQTNKLLPEWWGAKCDGRNDDTAAIQAAIKASEAFVVSFPNTPSPSVLIPPTPCKISSPLIINMPTTLAGEDGAMGQIVQTANAPAITTYLRGHGALNTGPSLVSGPGSSMVLTGPNTYPWLKLREHPNMNLDGQNALTVEAFVKLTQALNGAFSLVSSAGLAGASPRTEAFYLGIGNETNSGDGKLFGLMTVNGVPYPLIGSTIVSLNTVHHIGLTYDGSTIRLFLDGMPEGSATASGKINQGTFEEVSIGPDINLWPNGTLYHWSQPGFIDSVRISDVPRYVADFRKNLPKSKFSSDNSTLALLNFDNIQGPWVVGNSRSGDIWFPVINVDDLQIGGVVLRDLVLGRSGGVSGDGLFGFSTIDSQFVNITSSQGNWDGMEFTGSCYRNHFTDLFLYGTYCDFCGGGNSGVNQFDGGQFDGGLVLMGLYGWQAVIHDLYGQMEGSDQFGLVYTSGGGFGGGLLATGYACDTEGSPPGFVSCFDYAGEASDVVVLTAPYLTSPGTNPPMRINGGGSLILIGPDFFAPAAPEMIHVAKAPSRPIAVVSPAFYPGTASVLVDNNAPLNQIDSGITNSCAGTGTLSLPGNKASVSNSCITGNRPVICTDNSGTAAAISCKASKGSLSVTGVGNSQFSWAQF